MEISEGLSVGAEISISMIETALRELPTVIHDKGQELIQAENELCKVEAQLEIDKAKIRLTHIGEDLPSKVVESFAIVGTEKQQQEVIELTRKRDLIKLEKDLNEDKLLSVKKIANLRNIYQA